MERGARWRRTKEDWRRPDKGGLVLGLLGGAITVGVLLLGHFDVEGIEVAVIGVLAGVLAYVLLLLVSLAVAWAKAPARATNDEAGRLRDRAEKAEKAAAKATARSVEPGHRERLHGQLDQMLTAVEGNRLTGEGFDEAFEAHYPELTERMREWNAAVQLSIWSESLLLELEREAKTHGVTEERFHVKSVRDALFIVTVQRADSGTLNAPLTLALEYRQLGTECAIELNGSQVGAVPMEPADQLNERVRDAFQAIESLAAAAQTWEVSTKIEPATQHRLELRDVRKSELEMELQVERIPATANCPVCRKNLHIGG